MAAMTTPPATATEETQTGTPPSSKSGDEVVTAVYEYGNLTTIYFFV